MFSRKASLRAITALPRERVSRQLLEQLWRRSSPVLSDSVRNVSCPDICPDEWPCYTCSLQDMSQIAKLCPDLEADFMNLIPPLGRTTGSKSATDTRLVGEAGGTAVAFRPCALEGQKHLSVSSGNQVKGHEKDDDMPTPSVQPKPC